MRVYVGKFKVKIIYKSMAHFLKVKKDKYAICIANMNTMNFWTS